MILKVIQSCKGNVHSNVFIMDGVQEIDYRSITLDFENEDKLLQYFGCYNKAVYGGKYRDGEPFMFAEIYVYKVKDGYIEKGTPYKILTDNVAYLMGDDGQTIERIGAHTHLRGK